MSDEVASPPAPPAPLFHESYAAIYGRLPPSQQREAVKRLTLCKFPLKPEEVSTENPRVLVCLQALLLTYERKKARATVGSKARRKADLAKANAQALSTIVDEEPALAEAIPTVSVTEAEAKEPLPPAGVAVKQATKKHRMGAAKAPSGVVSSEIARLEACSIECAASDDLPPVAPVEPVAAPTTVPVINIVPVPPTAHVEPPTRRPTRVAKKATPVRGNSLVSHR